MRHVWWDLSVQVLFLFLLGSKIKCVQGVNVSYVMEAMGCFSKRDVVVMGERAPEKTDHTAYDISSCKAACLSSPSCMVWSFDPGPKFTAKSLFKPAMLPNIDIYASIDIPLPDWPSIEGPECYLTSGSTSVTNITIRYALQAVTGFRTCGVGSMGCFAVAASSNISDVDQLEKANGASEFMCKNGCFHRNYTYVGFTKQSQCFCGDAFGSGRKSNDLLCANPCDGNPNSNCGDDQHIHVVATGLVGFDKMCVFGRMEVVFDQVNVPVVYAESSVRKCQLGCVQKLAMSCVMWSFNSTHCSLYYRSDLKQNNTVRFIPNEQAFVGFGDCSEQQGTIYHATINAPALQLKPSTSAWVKTGDISGSHRFTSWLQHPQSTDKFRIIGDYGVSTGNSPTDQYYVARDESGDALRSPISLHRVWNRDNTTLLWSANCAAGYSGFGDLASIAYEKPTYFVGYRCIQNDLMNVVTSSRQLWSRATSGADHFAIWEVPNRSTLSGFHFYKAATHQPSSSHMNLHTINTVTDYAGGKYVMTEHTVAFETKTVIAEGADLLYQVSWANSTNVYFRSLKFGTPPQSVLDEGWLLCGQNPIRNPVLRVVRKTKGWAVANPTGFELISAMTGFNITSNRAQFATTLDIWRMICPDGYFALSDITTMNSSRPDVQLYACIHGVFLTPARVVFLDKFGDTSFYAVGSNCFVDLTNFFLATKGATRKAYRLKRHKETEFKTPRCKTMMRNSYRVWSKAVTRHESQRSERTKYVENEKEKQRLAALKADSYSNSYNYDAMGYGVASSLAGSDMFGQGSMYGMQGQGLSGGMGGQAQVGGMSGQALGGGMSGQAQGGGISGQAQGGGMTGQAQGGGLSGQAQGGGMSGQAQGGGMSGQAQGGGISGQAQGGGLSGQAQGGGMSGQAQGGGMIGQAQGGGMSGQAQGGGMSGQAQRGGMSGQAQRGGITRQAQGGGISGQAQGGGMSGQAQRGGMSGQAQGGGMSGQALGGGMSGQTQGGGMSGQAQGGGMSGQAQGGGMSGQAQGGGMSGQAQGGGITRQTQGGGMSGQALGGGMSGQAQGGGMSGQAQGGGMSGQAQGGGMSGQAQGGGMSGNITQSANVFGLSTKSRVNSTIESAVQNASKGFQNLNASHSSVVAAAGKQFRMENRSSLFQHNTTNPLEHQSPVLSTSGNMSSINLSSKVNFFNITGWNFSSVGMQGQTLGDGLPWQTQGGWMRGQAQRSGMSGQAQGGGMSGQAQGGGMSGQAQGGGMRGQAQGGGMSGQALGGGMSGHAQRGAMSGQAQGGGMSGQAQRGDMSGQNQGGDISGQAQGGGMSGQVLGVGMRGQAQGGGMSGQAQGGGMSGQALGGGMSGQALGGGMSGQALGGGMSKQAQGGGMSGQAQGGGMSGQVLGAQLTNITGNIQVRNTSRAFENQALKNTSSFRAKTPAENNVLDRSSRYNFFNLTKRNGTVGKMPASVAKPSQRLLQALTSRNRTISRLSPSRNISFRYFPSKPSFRNRNTSTSQRLHSHSSRRNYSVSTASRNTHPGSRLRPSAPTRTFTGSAHSSHSSHSSHGIRRIGSSHSTTGSTRPRPHNHLQRPTSGQSSRTDSTTLPASAARNFVRITLPTTLGEAIKDWGCYMGISDFVLLTNDVITDFLGDLKYHCEKDCKSKKSCLAWSFFPDFLNPYRKARCYHTSTQTALDSVNLTYVPGAYTGFMKCDKGYIGCFTDNRARPDLPKIRLIRNADFSSCLRVCQAYTYAGLQNHRECRCGNSFGNYNQSATNGSECDRACEKTPSNNCGGFSANSVYRTGNSRQDKMCIMGRFYLGGNHSSLVSREESVKRCAAMARLWRLKDCVMWSHNGTHCKLIYKSWMLLDSVQNQTFVVGERTYTGFSDCSMKNGLRGGTDGIYQHTTSNTAGTVYRLAFENKTVKDASIFSTQPATGPTQLTTWSADDRYHSDSWRLLGTPISGPSSSITSELARSIQGHGITQPTGFNLIGEDDVNRYWKIECPATYVALGDVVSNMTSPPDVNNFACVHEVFVSRGRLDPNPKWQIPNSDLEVREIFSSYCPGRNLSYFAVFNTSRVEPRVVALKPVDKLTIHCKEPITVPATPSPKPIPAPSLVPPTPPVIHQKFTAGNALRGWGCYNIRDSILMGTEINATALDGKIYKDSCMESCIKNSECVVWSFVPALLSPWRGTPYTNERCYHVLSNDLVANLTLADSPDAFMGFTNCESGYVGCFADTAGLRDLEISGSYKGATIDSCKQSCSAKGAAYFGLQFGRECWCGETFGSHGWMPTEQACSMACTSNPTEVCGNNATNSLYRTGLFGNDSMLVLGQVSMAEHVLENAEIIEEKAIYDCRFRCEWDCKFWAHNGSHCFLINEQLAGSLTPSGSLNLAPANRSFVGFPDQYPPARELLKTSDTRLEMNVKVIDVPVTSAVVFQEGRNQFLSVPSEVSNLSGYFPLGQIGVVNSSSNVSFLSVVLAKPVVGQPLALPTSMHEIWSRNEVPGGNNPLKFYHMECPKGYSSLGDVGTTSKTKPNGYRCVHNDFLRPVTIDAQIMSETSRRYHDVSVWSTKPVNPHADMNFNFFKAVDHLTKPDPDHLHLFTLPKILPDRDGSFSYKLQDLSEIEVASETSQNPNIEAFYRQPNETAVIKMFRVFDVELQDSGYFRIGQVASADNAFEAEVPKVRNIQGDGLSYPTRSELIGNASAFADADESAKVEMSFWKLECKSGYHAIGDVVTTTRNPPNLRDYACVNRKHLSPAHAGGLVWNHQSESAPLHVIRVEPDSCAEGQQMNFFIAAKPHNVTGRNLYVLKKSPDLSYTCQSAVVYPASILGTTIVREIPLLAEVLQGSFKQMIRNNLLVGQQVPKTTDLLECRDTCFGSCVAASFIPNYTDKKQSICYHTSRDTLLSDVKLRSVDGAFTYINQRDISSSEVAANQANCSFLPLFISPSNYAGIVATEFTSEGSCSQSCKENVATCALWSVNSTHCMTVSSARLTRSGMPMDLKSSGITGFSTCKSLKDLLVYENRNKLEIRLGKFDGRLSLFANSSSSPQSFRAYDADHINGYYMVGVAGSNRSNQDDVLPLFARTTDPTVLVPPLDVTEIVPSPPHKFNFGHMWKVICPNGFSTIGPLTTSELNPPDTAKIRCISNEFLVMADYGPTLRKISANVDLRTLTADNGTNFDLNFVAVQDTGSRSKLYVLPETKNVNGNSYLYTQGPSMMVETRKHTPQRSNIEIIHALINDTKSDLWKPVLLPDGWKGLGEMFTGSQNFDWKFLEIRNVYGQGTMSAVGSTRIGSVSVSKNHHDEHTGHKSNLTFYKLDCPHSYVALSDVAKYDDEGAELDHSQFSCVHRVFTTGGRFLNTTILSLPDISSSPNNQLQVKEIVANSPEGESAAFFAAHHKGAANTRQVYALRKSGNFVATNQFTGGGQTAVFSAPDIILPAVVADATMATTKRTTVPSTISSVATTRKTTTPTTPTTSTPVSTTKQTTAPTTSTPISTTRKTTTPTTSTPVVTTIKTTTPTTSTPIATTQQTTTPTTSTPVVTTRKTTTPTTSTPVATTKQTTAPTTNTPVVTTRKTTTPVATTTPFIGTAQNLATNTDFDFYSYFGGIQERGESVFDTFLLNIQNFTKRGVLFKGELVNSRSLEHCRDSCLIDFTCLSWSREFGSSGNCYHVYSQTGMKVKVESSPGATLGFAQTDPASASGECVIPDIKLEVTGNSKLPSSSATSNVECRRLCGKSKTCLLWSFSSGQCSQVSSLVMRDHNVTISFYKGSAVGFGVCFNETLAIYDSNVTSMLMQAFQPSLSTLPQQHSIFTSGNTAISAYHLTNIYPGYYIIGQPITKQGENVSHLVIAKDMVGEPLAAPWDATGIKSVFNGTVWSLICPTGYKALGSFVFPDNVAKQDILDTHRCVHNSYLHNGTVKQIYLNKNQLLQTTDFGFFTLGSNSRPYNLVTKTQDSRGRELYEQEEYAAMQVERFPSKQIFTMKSRGNNPLYFFNAQIPGNDWVAGTQHASLYEQYQDELDAYRNLQGKAVVVPSGANMVGYVRGAQVHHALHDPSQLVNYTFWNLQCPAAYHALGDVVLMDSTQPELDRYVCVHEEFLYKGYIDKSMWSDESTADGDLKLWRVKNCQGGNENAWVATSSVRNSRPDVYHLRPISANYDTIQPHCAWGNKDPGEIFISKKNGSELELRTGWNWKNTFKWDHSNKPISMWEPVDPNNEFYVIGHTAVEGLTEPPIIKAVMARSISGNALAAPIEMASYWSIGYPASPKFTNGSLWHMNCPEGFVTLGDMAAPFPAFTMNSRNSSFLKDKYRCISKEFAVASQAVEQPLWYVNSSDYGKASIWPVALPVAKNNSSLDFGFVKAANHETKPDITLYALRPFDQKTKSTMRYSSAVDMGLYLKKTRASNKVQEIVVSSFEDFTYSFWQAEPMEGYKIIGQVAVDGADYESFSYVARSINNTASIAAPLKPIQIGLCDSAACAFWKIKCPKNYQALSDFVLPVGEQPDLDNIACVHEDFLTSVKSEYFAAIDSFDLETMSDRPKCDVVDFNFFAVSGMHRLYTIKNGSDITGCTNHGDVISYDGTYNGNGAAVSDIPWFSCFSKRDVILRGKPVNAVNDFGDPDLIKCQIYCQMNIDCFAWSFSINNNDDANCYYVYRQDNLDDVAMMSSPGAFMETKSCDVKRLKTTYLGCYEDNSYAEFDFVAMKTGATIDTCLSSCSDAGYPFAGLQRKSTAGQSDRDECRCGVSFGGSGLSKESSCFYRCLVYSSQTCGGDSALSVHATGSRDSDDNLCIIGRLEPVITNLTGVQNQGSLSLPECHSTCSAKPLEQCWIWAFNVTECVHIPLSHANGSGRVTFLRSSPYSQRFVGFAKCSEESGLIYEEKNYQTQFVATYKQSGKVLLKTVTSMSSDSEGNFNILEAESGESDVQLGQVGQSDNFAIPGPLLEVSSETSDRNTVDAEYEQIWPVTPDYDDEEPYSGGRFWKMNCPVDYRSLGDVSSPGQSPPSGKYKCIHKGLVQKATIGPMLWSKQEDSELGNISVWSIESIDPLNVRRSNYFVVNTNFSKPDRQVYELKPDFADVTGRWKKTVSSEGLRFEAKLSFQNSLELSFKQNGTDDLPVILTQEQTYRAWNSNRTDWLTIQEPEIHGDWKVFGQQLKSNLQNRTHGVRLGRNIEGPALLEALAMENIVMFTTVNTSGSRIKYAIKNFRCPPQHKGLGQIVDVFDHSKQADANIHRYVCVHDAFLVKAQLGPALWNFTKGIYGDSKMKTVSLHQVVPVDESGEDLGFFQAVINNDYKAVGQLHTLKRHKDGVYPVFIPPVVIGMSKDDPDAIVVIKPSIGKPPGGADAGSPDKSTGNVSPHSCEILSPFMIAFILALIALIIVTAILIYTCHKRRKARLRASSKKFALEIERSREDLEVNSAPLLGHEKHGVNSALGAGKLGQSHMTGGGGAAGNVQAVVGAVSGSQSGQYMIGAKNGHSESGLAVATAMAGAAGYHEQSTAFSSFNAFQSAAAKMRKESIEGKVYYQHSSFAGGSIDSRNEMYAHGLAHDDTAGFGMSEKHSKVVYAAVNKHDSGMYRGSKEYLEMQSPSDGVYIVKDESLLTESHQLLNAKNRQKSIQEDGPSTSSSSERSAMLSWQSSSPASGEESDEMLVGSDSGDMSLLREANVGNMYGLPSTIHTHSNLKGDKFQTDGLTGFSFTNGESMSERETRGSQSQEHGYQSQVYGYQSQTHGYQSQTHGSQSQTHRYQSQTHGSRSMAVASEGASLEQQHRLQTDIDSSAHSKDVGEIKMTSSTLQHTHQLQQPISTHESFEWHSHGVSADGDISGTSFQQRRKSTARKISLTGQGHIQGISNENNFAQSTQSYGGTSIIQHSHDNEMRSLSGSNGEPGRDHVDFQTSRVALRNSMQSHDTVQTVENSPYQGSSLAVKQNTGPQLRNNVMDVNDFTHSDFQDNTELQEPVELRQSGHTTTYGPDNHYHHKTVPTQSQELAEANQQYLPDAQAFYEGTNMAQGAAGTKMLHTHSNTYNQIEYSKATNTYGTNPQSKIHSIKDQPTAKFSEQKMDTHQNSQIQQNVKFQPSEVQKIHQFGNRNIENVKTSRHGENNTLNLNQTLGSHHIDNKENLTGDNVKYSNHQHSSPSLQFNGKNNVPVQISQESFQNNAEVQQAVGFEQAGSTTAYPSDNNLDLTNFPSQSQELTGDNQQNLPNAQPLYEGSNMAQSIAGNKMLAGTKMLHTHSKTYNQIADSNAANAYGTNPQSKIYSVKDRPTAKLSEQQMDTHKDKTVQQKVQSQSSKAQNIQQFGNENMFENVVITTGHGVNNNLGSEEKLGLHYIDNEESYSAENRMYSNQQHDSPSLHSNSKNNVPLQMSQESFQNNSEVQEAVGFRQSGTTTAYQFDNNLDLTNFPSQCQELSGANQQNWPRAQPLYVSSNMAQSITGNQMPHTHSKTYNQIAENNSANTYDTSSQSKLNSVEDQLKGKVTEQKMHTDRDRQIQQQLQSQSPGVQKNQQFENGNILENLKTNKHGENNTLNLNQTLGSHHIGTKETFLGDNVMYSNHQHGSQSSQFNSKNNVPLLINQESGTDNLLGGKAVNSSSSEPFTSIQGHAGGSSSGNDGSNGKNLGIQAGSGRRFSSTLVHSHSSNKSENQGGYSHEHNLSGRTVENQLGNTNTLGDQKSSEYDQKVLSSSGTKSKKDQQESLIGSNDFSNQQHHYRSAKDLLQNSKESFIETKREGGKIQTSSENEQSSTSYVQNKSENRNSGNEFGNAARKETNNSGLSSETANLSSTGSANLSSTGLAKLSSAGSANLASSGNGNYVNKITHTHSGSISTDRRKSDVRLFSPRGFTKTDDARASIRQVSAPSRNSADLITSGITNSQSIIQTKDNNSPSKSLDLTTNSNAMKQINVNSVFDPKPSPTKSSPKSLENISPKKGLFGRLRTWSRTSEESASSGSPSPKKPKPPIKPKPKHLKSGTISSTHQHTHSPRRARAETMPHGLMPKRASARAERSKSFDVPRLYAVKRSPMPERVLVQYERNHVVQGGSRIQYHRSSIQANMPERRFIISVLDENKAQNDHRK